MTVYEIHHVDGLAMSDAPPPPPPSIEDHLAVFAMFEQRARAVLGEAAAGVLIGDGTISEGDGDA